MEYWNGLLIEAVEFPSLEFSRRPGKIHLNSVWPCRRLGSEGVSNLKDYFSLPIPTNYHKPCHITPLHYILKHLHHVKRSSQLLMFWSLNFQHSDEWPIFISLPQVFYFSRGHLGALYFSNNFSKAQIILFISLILASSNFFHSKPSTSNSITHPIPLPYNLFTTSSLISLLSFYTTPFTFPLQYPPGVFLPLLSFCNYACPNIPSSIKLSYPLSISCCPPAALSSEVCSPHLPLPT